MRTVRKPWGRFEQFAQNERVTVKLLHIGRGQRLSYQYHLRRAEFWHVVAGRVLTTLNGRNRVLSEGGNVAVAPRVRHRIRAIVDSVVLEVATGDFDEGDIVRVEDDYGRAGGTKQ
jgi:mannose-1-phosphate guanylyltransferase